MKKAALFLPLLLLASGCIADRPPVKHSAREEKEEVLILESDRHIIENNLFRLSLYPGLCGGIENITLKNGNIPLLWGGKQEQITRGPLIVYPKATGVLFMEKFWRCDDSIISNMVVKESTPDSVTLYCPEYGSLSAELTRKVTLEKDALAVRFDVDVKFSSSPREGYTSPWLNLMPSGEVKWVAAIPTVGGDAVNGLGNRTDFPATGIYRGGWHGPNTYFAPERNWIAVSAPAEKAAMALLFTCDKRKSTFYSWYSSNFGGKECRTIEVIMPQLALNEKFAGSYSYTLAVFPGISDLREIIGETAVEVKVDGKLVDLSFSAYRAVPARKVTLNITPAGKASVALGNAELPALIPGKAHTLRFQLPETGMKGRFSGTLGSEKFELLDVIR